MPLAHTPSPYHPSVLGLTTHRGSPEILPQGGTTSGTARLQSSPGIRLTQAPAKTNLGELRGAHPQPSRAQESRPRLCFQGTSPKVYKAISQVYLFHGRQAIIHICSVLKLRLKRSHSVSNNYSAYQEPKLLSQHQTVINSLTLSAELRWDCRLRSLP